MKAATPTDPNRSEWMKRVRRARTPAEDAVSASLRGLGYAYRRNVKSLPGSPDFANKRGAWAIFVNGCYWHHHTNCSRGTLPKANASFWADKFERNRRRDARAIKELRSRGFRVAIVWECKVRDAAALRTSLCRALPPKLRRDVKAVVA